MKKTYTVLTKAYLEFNQIYMIKLFYENSSQLETFHYFHEKASLYT